MLTIANRCEALRIVRWTTHIYWQIQMFGWCVVRVLNGQSEWVRMRKRKTNRFGQSWRNRKELVLMNWIKARWFITHYVTSATIAKNILSSMQLYICQSPTSALVELGFGFGSVLILLIPIIFFRAKNAATHFLRIIVLAPGAS